jgi:protein TonB
MYKEKKDKHFIHKPVYPGGPQAMKKFIGEHLVYPESAKETRIKGTVTIDYTIDYKGNVIETKIISSLGYGCDEEAERLVKLLKFDVPKQRARKIRFHKTINIHFRPPAKKKTPVKRAAPDANTEQVIQYQIIPTPKTKEETTKKDDGGYTYTVQF